MPRLLFEDWTHEDFRSVLDSEDEIEELGKTVVQVAKVRPGAAGEWAAVGFALTTDVPWAGGLPSGDSQLPSWEGACPAGSSGPLGWGWGGGTAREGTGQVSTWPLCS